MDAVIDTPVLRREGRFCREGEYWTIEFEGQLFRLADSKGLQYLNTLLERPWREIHVLDLVGVTGVDARAVAGDSGPLLDRQAKVAYRRRIGELRDIVDDPLGHGPEIQAEARWELGMLIAQLDAALGLAGRDRTTASAADRARQAVTKAIKRAAARIAEHSPALARHLHCSVRTGTHCVYLPDPATNICWQRS